MGVIRYFKETKPNNGTILQGFDHISNENNDWSSWTPCSRSCGHGFTTRNKKICLKLPAAVGYDCKHLKIQKKTCGLEPCYEIKGVNIPSNQEDAKSNGTISEKIQQSAHKTAVPYNGSSPEGTGITSGKPKHETKVVGLIRQELDADFLPWSTWSRCSATCGDDGMRTRTRQCSGKHRTNCIGDSYEKEECFVKRCPVSGGWSAWSDWTTCSQSCGKSVKLRMRKCDNPVPLYGGVKCEGPEEEHMKCDVPLCVVNGAWSPWSDWSGCTQSCGSGTKVRSRTCTNPAPANGGSVCQGKRKENMGCYLPSCPVDGGFSHWHSWSRCHKTCGPNSFRTRFRFCNNPPPSDGGKSCHGDRLQLSSCSVKPCPVDGGLSLWTLWSTCSKTCGETAVRSRERLCNNPVPSSGGKNCSGQTFQIKLCDQKPCHKDTIKKDPPKEDEQKESSLVQSIIEEKEELLTEKKSGKKTNFTSLKKKLIENLEKLAPDLSLTLNENEKDKTLSKGSNHEKKDDSQKMVVTAEISEQDVPTGNISKIDKIQYNAAAIVTGKLKEKKNEKKNENGITNLGSLIDPPDQSTDSSGNANPIKTCGFNPCKIAKCLSDPFADCIPNTDCDPVFYDEAGNIKQDCSVDTTFVTVPADQLCGHDPCKTAACLKLPNGKCLTSALCHPVYFDETGNVLNCTGVLRTPVAPTCGKDPCIGKLCPTDPDAKCFTDFQCKASFWDLNVKEEIIPCREPDREEEDQENADERSWTPSFSNTPRKKSFKRPWLMLNKAALSKILRNSQGNGIYFSHAKIKLLSGNEKVHHIVSSDKMKRKLCLFIYFIIFIRFRLAHVLTKRTKSNAKPVLSKLTGDGLHVKPSAVAQIKHLTHDANGVDRQQISYNLDLINHNGSSTLLYSQDNDVINGGLTDWSSWSECSRDCHKRSLRSRERYCINPAPSNGGADCEGERFQLDLCPVVPCSTATARPKPRLDESSSYRSRKKDRHEKALSRMVSWRLGEWSGWDKCDCGKGYQKRYRQCYSHGGIVCPGSTVQTKACRPNVCQEPEKSSLVNVDPKDFCGFNPCDLSKCLVAPLGSCVSDYKCRPVFFDEKNKRVKECVGKRVYINPEKVSYVCKVNPCDLTRCLMDFSEERCVVGTRCQAVYYNAEGHPQKCTAILKVPARRVCGYDPCNGEACQSRPNARCLVTSKCRPIYVNAFNERIRKCEEKAGKKSSGIEVGREEEFEAEPDSDDDEDEDGDDDVISDDRNDDEDADDDNDDDSSDDHYDNQDNDDDDDDDYEGYRDHDNSKSRHNEKEFAYSKHRGNDPEDNDNGHGNENEDGDDDDEDGQAEDNTTQNTSNDRYAENFRNFLLKSGVHNNENNPQTLNSTRNNFSSNSSKTLVNLLNSENGQRRNKLNSSTISLNNINVSSLNLGDIVKGKLNSSQGVITGTVQETMKIVSNKKPTTYYYFETKGNSGKENQQVMVITAPKTKKSSVSSKRKHMNQG